jgi:Peptidase family M23
MQRIFILFFFSLCLVWGFTSPSTPTAQGYPQGYFMSPVGHAIELTGNFGELRPNHFHTGLDIRPAKSGESEPIFAAAEGYISRIQIEPSGYGNLLEITHPNGFTSVYAHLDRINDDLNNYTKENQYQRESFQVELFPTPNQFPIQKGQQIGMMGNTGGSQGMHLHFEIRDAASGQPLNPLLFGIYVADNKAPIFYEMRAYFLNANNESYGSRSFSLRDKKGNYTIQNDTLTIPAERIGLGIRTYDEMDALDNKNGIFSFEEYLDSTLSFGYNFETIAFNESRYVNAHLDYRAWKRSNTYLNRCYRLPGNKLSLYKNAINDGVITLPPNRPVKVELRTKDVAGNEAKLLFWLQRSESLEFPSPAAYSQVFDCEKTNDFSNNEMALHLPEGCLYENLYFKYDMTQGASSAVYSPTHHLHEDYVPMHKGGELKVRPSGPIYEALRSKYFLAYYDHNGDVSACGGTWEGEMLKIKTYAFGDYCVMLDTIAPSIKPISFKTDLKNASKMSFRIKDNFENARGAEGIGFRATVDGAWILMEYDPKSNSITHRFDNKKIGIGEHQLKIVVKDNRENVRVFESLFTR